MQVDLLTAAEVRKITAGLEMGELGLRVTFVQHFANRSGESAFVEHVNYRHDFYTSQLV